MIVTNGLTKRFGKTPAVEDLTFTVTPGVVTGFLGPNGSGKSTTMRMIMGLDVPDAGRALVNGLPLPGVALAAAGGGRTARRQGVPPRPQRPEPPALLGPSNAIPAARVDEVLDVVGLTAVADRRAGKFSLGMGQRLGHRRARSWGTPASSSSTSPSTASTPKASAGSATSCAVSPPKAAPCWCRAI